MAKSKSYGGLIVLLVIVVGCGVGAWYYFKGRTEKPPEFQTAKVDRGNIVQAVTATGDLQPVVTVDIGAQVSGQIKEVLVDYNSVVKAGDVLAKIDEATPTQRLEQAKADLASTEANNKLIKVNVARTRELFGKQLVSQQELDQAEAQLSQSESQLLQRKAAVANAALDLERCTITAPIDGLVLDRKTDKGRTVNASMNAPVLFTMVNDLSKMQINAAVAEADVGMIAEGQQVKFTVDAFPNEQFVGTVRMVRNVPTTAQSVVSYATIIDVSNEGLKLKPGMTANVSIIVQQRPNVVRVENGTLRVRIPQEMLPRTPPPTSGKGEKGAPQGTVAMTDSERMQATREIIQAVGYDFRSGTPATPDQIEKAKILAKEKGLDPDLVAARLATPGQRKGFGGGDRGDRSSRGGGGGGGGGREGGRGGDRGFNNTIVTRTLYKLIDSGAEKKVEPVSVKLGVSDGFYTEVLDGLKEGDVMIKSVTLPGSAAAAQQQSGVQNPFQSRGPGGFSGGSMRGR